LGFMFDGDDGGHEEHGPDTGWPSLGEPRPAQDRRAGLPLHRHQAQIGGELFGGLELVVMQHRQHVVAHLGTDGGYADEQVAVLFQVGVAVNVLVNGLLQLGQGYKVRL
jgi:hypothetical protein